MSLEKQDLDYLQDQDFLLRKRAILLHIEELLAQCQTALKAEITQNPFDFPEGCEIQAGKISRGENYRGLPYLVLDYPRMFKQDSIFSLRTMLWWGHEFSCTLYILGQARESYRQSLASQLPQARYKDWYLGVHESPWEYYFAPDNFKALQEMDSAEKSRYGERPFYKLSRQLSLDQYDNLSHWVVKTWRQFREVLE